jgi:hypothetical protein
MLGTVVMHPAPVAIWHACVHSDENRYHIDKEVQPMQGTHNGFVVSLEDVGGVP